MRTLNGTLYLEFSEMVQAGVSDGYLRKAKSTNTNCWHFATDPADKRRVLIGYEALKPAYKELVVAKFGNPYEYMSSANIKALLMPDAAALDFFRGYTYLHDGTTKALPAENIAAYTLAAQWMNLLAHLTSKEGKADLKTLGLTKEKLWATVCTILEVDKVALPYSYSRLTRKLGEYQTTGYSVLVSKKFGNANSEKLTADAKKWLEVVYGMGTKADCEWLWLQYNAEALQPHRVAAGWQPVKSSQCIYTYLHQPEVRQRWLLSRQGSSYTREQLSYVLKTKLPSWRDALWYGDGTKLNFYYQNEQGKIKADLWVYEVCDAHSEVLLGYSISETEDHLQQYMAYRTAIEFAGHKPHELKYDKQGGHRKMKDFLESLARISVFTKPYNGRSKTIEGIFGRLQQQHMSHYPFFTGQNITAKRQDSKVNIETVLANKANLPTYEQVCAIYTKVRNDWNNAPHPKHRTKSRMEVYLETANPNPQPVTELDRIELFWVRDNTPRLYTASGIGMTFRGLPYEYEVLTELQGQKLPDMAFRARYIDQRFVVKYDPSDLTMLALYIDSPAGLRFVAYAEPRLQVERAAQAQAKGERATIAALLNFGKEEEARRVEARQKLEEETGISTEGHWQHGGSLGEYLKAVSAQVATGQRVLVRTDGTEEVETPYYPATTTQPAGEDWLSKL